MGSGEWKVPSRSDAYTGSVDASLFSVSLPVLPPGKFSFADSIHGGQSVDGMTSDLNRPQEDVQGQSSLEEVGRNHIGSILPGNEEELLAGIMDGFNLSGLPNQMEDLEEYDIFRSGGGMEMDSDPRGNLILGMSRVSLSAAATAAAGSNQTGLTNSVGTVVGEHPYGEHPSRTLFVRNINSNIEDSELRVLFEQYGDIRALYTACKHRGFVMISYYDIRSARNALRALQNMPLRRRKLDIHFSIPKENPSDKDINQGTLVVFNLDPSVSNEELRDIFGTYGEIKEIRATPQKRNHKFIEFYDVRAAEAALRSLNRSDIAGKCIKLEPSHPGGAHRNLSQQCGHDLEQYDTRGFQQQLGSPPANSLTGNWIQFSSPFEHTPLHAFCQSPGLGTSHISMSTHMPGLASILPPHVSNLANIAPNSEDLVRGSHVDQAFINTSSAFPQSHSFPESALSAYPLKVPSFCPSASHASGVGTSSGSKFLLGSSPPYSEHSNSSAWSTPSSGHPFTSREQGLGIPYSARHEPFLDMAHHHVGSAPPGIALEQNFGYFPESPETSFIDAMPYGCMGLCQNKRHFRRNMDARTSMHGGLTFSEHFVENSSPNFRILSSPRRGATPLDGCLHPGSGTNGIAALAERGRSRRAENRGNPVETKKQYQLDLDKIVSGEDTRTTLMIKNIPNKYTSNMLLAVIDESNKGTYDFLYLPIDFKNKCNVGYAFINMVAPLHIISFYQAFNGKKWEKFNSEKVASLAYARIQGKAALVAHFQNSSLMNEDKRCRPIVFNLELVESGNQEIPLAERSMDARMPNSSRSENAPKGLHEEREET